MHTCFGFSIRTGMQIITSNVTHNRTADGCAAHILYDTAEIPNETDLKALFEDDGQTLDGGRGGVALVGLNARQYVRRHYRRGGLPAKFIKDRYRWQGLEKTRAWREFELTAALWAKGLPTLQPVAARVIKRGRWYQADLVTVYVDATPLSAQLNHIDAARWREIGQLVRHMHALNVDHPDLNAHNILLGDEAIVMDFDRGEIRQPGAWKQSNCDRLRRSLDKISSAEQEPLIEQGWQQFLEAYHAP